MRILQLIRRKFQGFALIGSNGDEDAADLHHDTFTVKDEALPTAVNYFVENALYLLDYFAKGKD